MINNLNIIKIFAIFSVIVAHIDIHENLIHFNKIKSFYRILGSLGVGLFFVIIGFNLSKSKFNTHIDCKKTLKYITPWLLSGTCIYIYLCLRKWPIPISYINFLIGNGSYLYFMTLLNIIFLFGNILHSRFTRLFILLISSIYMIFRIGIMPFGISEHLNILLWIPYICLGFAIGKNGKLSELMSSPEFVIITLSAISGFTLQRLDVTNSTSLNYQNPILVFLISTIFIFFIKINLPINNCYIKTLSRNTLFIYLWHMPLIGLANYLSNNYLSSLHILSPFLVLIFFYNIIAKLYKTDVNIKFLSAIGIAKI